MLAGYGATEIRRFQLEAGLTGDGIAGPRTLAALHQWLKGLPPVQFARIPVTDANTATGGGFIAALIALLKSIFTGK